MTSHSLTSTEHFLQRPNRPTIRAQILHLNGMLYIWIGDTHSHPLLNLQLAYPNQVIMEG